MKETFTNWAQTVRFTPSSIVIANSVQKVVEVVEQAILLGKGIRCVGSAHSWSPLIATPDILLSIDDYLGIYDVDKQNNTVWVRGGTKLHQLGKLLHAEGLAMENLGDVDHQTIVGAAITGTHGTGAGLGIVATQIIELKLVNGKAEVLHIKKSDDPELFSAAQVSLGALGVVTDIKLQCVPAYKLEFTRSRVPLTKVLAELDTYNTANRNFEFFWFPYSKLCAPRIWNPTTQPAQPHTLTRYFDEVVMENGLWKIVSEACRLAPALAKPASRLAANVVSTGKEVDYSYRLFATQRNVKFMEMEFAVPADVAARAFMQVKKWLETSNIRVHFPLEYRIVKGDNIMLSPATGRDTVFIAAHQYLGMPYERYFDGLESIFVEYGGRPHWGKFYTCKTDYFGQVYPLWNRFLEIRAEQDPHNIFVNTYLKQIFGL